jgi:hypothetical protein
MRYSLWIQVASIQLRHSSPFADLKTIALWLEGFDLERPTLEDLEAMAKALEAGSKETVLFEDQYGTVECWLVKIGQSASK